MARPAPKFLESLEQRTLLAADLLSDGTLSIAGSETRDVIVVEQADDRGSVRVFGVPNVADGTVFGGVETIRVALGDGDDLFRVDGAIRTAGGAFMSVIAFGGAGDDTMIGGRTFDTFHGGDGDDTLIGGELDDILIGNAGDDDIWGNRGFDRIWGGEGDDDIYGGVQRDFIFGGSGDDDIYGNQGNDRIEGGDDDDDLFGGNGRDELFGGRGFDSIRGGFGADILRGEDDDDDLFGGGGDDDLWAGLGSNDRMFGGPGSDGFFGKRGGVMDADDDDRGYDSDDDDDDDDIRRDLDDDFWEFADAFSRRLGGTAPESFAQLITAARSLNSVAGVAMDRLEDLAELRLGDEIADDFVPFDDAGEGIIEALEDWVDRDGPLVDDLDNDGLLIDFSDIIAAHERLLNLLPQQDRAEAQGYIDTIRAAEPEYLAYEQAFNTFFQEVRQSTTLSSIIVFLLD